MKRIRIGIIGCGAIAGNHRDAYRAQENVEISKVFDANVLTKKDYEQLMRFQTHQPGIHELMRELRALVPASVPVTFPAS